MPKRSLTAAAVERLKPPKEGHTSFFDAGYPGLSLRVSYGGAKAYDYFFRLHGRLKRITLGRHPSMTLADARVAWRNARAHVAKGEDPSRARPVKTNSFGAVAEEWLRRDQSKNRSYDEVKRTIEREVLPKWRDRMIGTIKRRDVMDLIDDVADRGAVTSSRRLHAYLHRLFTWSVGRGIVEANPMASMPKHGAEVKRDRVLTDKELSAVWRASTDWWPFAPMVRLLISTGARRSEIGDLRWSEVHGDSIKLEGARTKSGEPHSIPLSPQAAGIIRALPRFEGSDFVFTTTKRSGVSGWSKAKTRLDDAVGFTDWRIHDIRRTVASGLQRLGFNLQVIESVLGHVSGSRSGVVGIYQRHKFDDEKREALNAWAKHVGGKP